MAHDIYLYNSLSRTKEKFVPIDPSKKHVKLYACGPTVYSYAHVGNARAAVVFDTLRRILTANDMDVLHVANITDIDDKIIDAANKEGKDISEITNHYADIYNADMGALNVQKPTIQPRATDHVDGMIDMISTLIEKGHAYENQGHALFSVPSFDSYGALSGRNRDEQIAGARVEVAPYKKDPADFVLWKPSTDTQPGWDSPWGYGRPGWHIECSVMARQYLGDVFDIHGGGIDLTFPHHENEIAQSCCCTGHDHLANYWVHNGFVMVEGEKMSKSLGNVLLTHDLVAAGTPGEAIRMTLMATHYRQPLNWTQDGLHASLKTLDKWYDIIGNTPQESVINDDYLQALNDDMNTPLAISILHKIAKDTPQYLVANANIIGLLTMPYESWVALRQTHHADIDDAMVNDLIKKRNDARTNKDFATADKIRDELSAMGITIKDNPDGTTSWHFS